MVVSKRLVPLMIALLMLAMPLGIYAVSADKSVMDEAGLFSGTEESMLESSALALSDKYNMDIVITTTENADGKSSREYADDYFDYNGYGRGSDFSGILFLIDMDNREIYISTSGEGIKYLTDQRIESILDRVFDSGLAEGDYYSAAAAFLDETTFYLEEGIPADQYSEDEGSLEPNKLTAIEAAASLIASLGLGGGFYGSVKSGYRVKNPSNPFSYRNNSIVNLANQDDRFIDKVVTSRIIPRTPPAGGGSSSGRSTTHRSSSGRTHGGGGRKF
jgi:uncharacterized protein